MRFKRLLTLVVAGLATLAAGCAAEEPASERVQAVAPESSPELVAEQTEAETPEPEADPAQAEGETSEPEAEPALAEADVEAAPSSTTSSQPEATTTSASALPADCDFSDHVDVVLDSVYQVVTADGIGTAFYLGDGEWLTAAHVVGTAYSVALYNDLKNASATIKGIDYDADLALLEGIGGGGAQALRIAEANTAQPGDAAIVVGYPLYENKTASVSRGVVSRYEEDDVGEVIVSDASVNPGNSGGPMFDECGTVIGVVFQKYVGVDVEGIGYAVSASDIAAVLPRLRRGFKGTPPETISDAVVEPATTAPPDPQGWVITKTEPDLLTGEVHLFMVVDASEVEREYDFYEMPSLAMGCEGGWSVWWGGDTVITYGDDVEVVYRVGNSEALTDTWLEDDELVWLSTSATDAILAAGPDDELVVRAYEYDGDIFATAVFPLEGMSDTVIEFTAQCSNPTWRHIIADWGRAVLTEGLDGQLEWLRFECPLEPHDGLDAVLFLGTAAPPPHDLDGWVRYRFGDEAGPWTSLGMVYRWDDGTAFSAFDTSRELESALDTDTTGILHMSIDRVPERVPLASDAFNVTGWREAKEWLRTSC